MVGLSFKNRACVLQGLRATFILAWPVLRSFWIFVTIQSNSIYLTLTMVELSLRNKACVFQGLRATLRLAWPLWRSFQVFFAYTTKQQQCDYGWSFLKKQGLWVIGPKGNFETCLACPEKLLDLCDNTMKQQPCDYG